VEVLDAQDDDTYLEKLVEVMTGPDEESQRVRMRILEAVVQHGWDISPWKEKVEAWLPEGYEIQGNKVVQVE